MNWFQRHRQEWIAERIAEKGYINRQDIMDKFEISIPQASLDLRKFMEAMPELLEYNKTAKRYECNVVLLLRNKSEL